MRLKVETIPNLDQPILVGPTQTTIVTIFQTSMQSGADKRYLASREAYQTYFMLSWL